MHPPKTYQTSLSPQNQRRIAKRPTPQFGKASALLGLLILSGAPAQATPAPPASGLSLHLDAGQIQGIQDGRPLSGGWGDKSDSNKVFSSPNPPTFLADSGDGFPAVRFDGAGHYLEGSFSLGSEATVFIVYANRRTPLKAAYQDTLVASAAGFGMASGIQLASSRLVEDGHLVQFGWNRDSYYQPAYRDQIGADEIVQWNGLDSMGGNGNDNGSLNNESVGARLESTQGGLILTSDVIASSDPLVSITQQSGSQLGLSRPGGSPIFNESLDSSWTFSFNQEVKLKQLLMSGFNNSNDTARVTITGGGSYDITRSNTAATDDWEDRSHLHLRVFTFPTPVTLALGSEVTIAAEGGGNPDQNIFYVGGIVAALPPSPPDYPGFVATGTAGGPLDSWVNGLDTKHAGTDILPNSYYLGTATYTSLPTSSSLFIGALNQSESFGQNDISELLIYDSVLGASERYAVQAYLGAKYNIAIANHPPQHPLSTYNHILGAQQIGRQYSFGESGRRVLDAARAVYRQGANVFKLAISRNYAWQNGVPINPDIGNLTELVRDEPSIRAVFDMPFKDLLFWASSFSVPNMIARATPDGLPLADQQKIYDEIYDLTVYLLETYSGTGRRFYVGNWEGDWVLAGLGSQNPESDITPARIKTMVDWATVRQQAIDDAKTETAHSDVEVWHYLEMNKGDWAIDNRPCVVNSVMPELEKLDFVSFSAYTVKNRGRADTFAVLDKIRDALPPIDSTLPDYLKPSGERLIIGEYGYFQGPDNQYDQVYKYVEEIDIFLSWGPPRFILMWEVFWEEDAGNGLPKNMHMINSKNELHPLYFLHENYYRNMQQWVEDYVENNGVFPSDTAYKDQARLQIGGFSPWPFSLTINPANSTTLQIPDAISSSLTESYSAQVGNGFGQDVFHESVLWELQPASHGATINSDTGALTLPGNASPGDYTVIASLASDPSASAASAVQFVLPVASIYDSLTDFSKVSITNPELEIVDSNAAQRFEGDRARVRRINSTGPQPLTWNVQALNRFHAKIYYFNNLNVSAEVSPDGSTWQAISLRVDPGVVTNQSWRRSWVAPSAPLPTGTHYLRLNLEDPVHHYTPQIGEVAIFGDATGYEFWKKRNSPNPSDQINPAISGPSAKVAAAGVSNLFRYLTEMGLSETDYTLMPELRLVGERLVYAIPFDATKSDLHVRVLASLDLQTWPYTVFDSTIDTATTEDGWLLINFDSLPDADAKFMRVVWEVDS